MLPYVTRKRKRNEKECQGNVVSNRATADLQMYFLRRSAIKFALLLKGINKQQQPRSASSVAVAATAAAVASAVLPNLMVAAAAEVVDNVVEEVFNPPPIHVMAAHPSPSVIAMIKKGMAVADDEGNFVVGGCKYFYYIALLLYITSTLALMADTVPWSGLRE